MVQLQQGLEVGRVVLAERATIGRNTMRTVPRASNFKEIEKNLFYLDLGETRIIPKFSGKGPPVHYEFASTKNKKANLFEMTRKLPDAYQDYSADSESEKLKAKYPLKLPTPGVAPKPLDEGENH